MAASLGKMPTTLVRRLTSAWSRSIRVCGVQFLAVLLGESHVGEDVVLGFVHENCQLGHLGPELVGDLTPLGPSRCRRPPGRRRWRRRRRRRAGPGGRHGPAGCGRSARGIFARWRRGSGSRRPSDPCGRRRSTASRHAARRRGQRAQELGPGRCHVNRHLASLWAPTPEIMQRSSLAATVSSRRRGIGGVFGGRPDGVGR